MVKLGTVNKWVLVYMVLSFYGGGAEAKVNRDLSSVPVSNEDYFDTNFFSLFTSSYVVSLSLGASWETAGQSQTLNLAPAIVKTYTADEPMTISPTGEFFWGLRSALPEGLEGQIGLAFVATGYAAVSGDIWDDADPLFDNYTYQFKVNHDAVNVKGKVSLSHWDLPVIPWASLALGVGFNKAYDFENTPIIYEVLQMPNFTDNTTTTFTYTVGIGLQYQFNPNWQIGAGYEFSDWGRSQLGAISSEYSGDVPSLSNLYTSSILFNLTYLA